ncbi:MAG: glycosyltransferase family 39 protein [Candidatus Aminicenantales bacterium]
MNTYKVTTRCKVYLSLIILFSLFLRLGLAYGWRGSFFERGNRISYIDPIASNLVRGNGFSLEPGQPTAVNEPLYPLLVALSYRLFGRAWFGVALLQSVVAALNALILFSLALIIFRSWKIGFSVFFLFLFYPFYIFQSVSISDTVFFCFLLALSVWTTVLSVKKRKLWIALISGGCWGLALLTRFSAVSIFPFALVYLFINLPAKKALKAAAAALLAALVVLAPWVYRNYSLSDQFLISTHGAIEVWFGYNRDTLHVVSNDITVDSMRRNLKDKVPALKEVETGMFRSSIEREAEEGRVLLREALDFALKNPVLSLRMIPVKLWKFWSWNYNPVPTTSDPVQDILRQVIYTVSYFPLLFLAFPGVVISRRIWRTHSIFIMLFIGYSALHALVYGFSRLRVPLDQFLIIYASVTLVFLLGKFRLFLTKGSGLAL